MESVPGLRLDKSYEVKSINILNAFRKLLTILPAESNAFTVYPAPIETKSALGLTTGELLILRNNLAEVAPEGKLNTAL